jgi:predicted nuclease of predicted toxin-antitoxin system
VILADQCVYGTTIRVLDEAGYAVTRLSGLASPTSTDDEVLRLSQERDLILLTNDKDFSNVLIYPPSAHCGIIVLRMSPDTEAATHEMLLQLLRDNHRDSLRRTLAIVDAHKYRLRS